MKLAGCFKATKNCYTPKDQGKFYFSCHDPFKSIENSVIFSPSCRSKPVINEFLLKRQIKVFCVWWQGGTGWTAPLTAPVAGGVWAVTWHVCAGTEEPAALWTGRAPAPRAGEEIAVINTVRSAHHQHHQTSYWTHSHSQKRLVTFSLGPLFRGTQKWSHHG